jgi:hypothetical protein
MTSAKGTHRVGGEQLPPVLSAPVIRHLVRWSQVRVAGLAGTSVATVRIYELDERAVGTAQREALRRVYRAMRDELLRG